MMHKYEECKIKIRGIKFLISSLMKLDSTDFEVKHRLESITQMCNELINEDIDSKEKGD